MEDEKHPDIPIEIQACLVRNIGMFHLGFPAPFPGPGIWGGYSSIIIPERIRPERIPSRRAEKKSSWF